MFLIDPRIEAQPRQRFTRPDAHRYLKPAPSPALPDAAAAWARVAERAEEKRRAFEREYRRELDALRYDFASLRVFLKAAKLELVLRNYAHACKYSPDQPRVPAGQPGGGQWTDGSNAGGTQYAQNARQGGYPVDLTEEEALGGHTIEGHVDKNPEYLLDEIRQKTDSAQRKGDSFDNLRVGSFPSLEAATKLVNSTLSNNQNIVDLVASGTLGGAQLDAYFDSPTGYEAFARSENSTPYIRPTYGVHVIVTHDSSVAKGYRVHTAFPKNSGR